MYDKQDVEALERQFNTAMEEADTGSALDAVRRIYAEFDRGGGHPRRPAPHRLRGPHGDRLPRRQVYKGRKGFQKWRSDMEELFEEERFQPEGIRSPPMTAGSSSAASTSRARESGADLDVPLAHVFQQRDRKVARFTAYSDIGDALGSVGLHA